MQKTVKIMRLFAALLVLLLLWGCTTKTVEEKKEDTYVLYYTDAQRYTLTTEEREVKGASIQEIAFNILSAMQTPETVGNYSLLTVDGLVKRVNQDADNIIGVYMTEEYSKLSVSDGVLLRAGIVKALIQLDGIEYVSIYVNEQPLTDSLGMRWGSCQPIRFWIPRAKT